MRAIYLVLFLLFAIIKTGEGKIFQRLEQGMRLSKGDELISTLGLYKLTMNDLDCSLNLYKFDQTSSLYQSTNQKFIPNITGSCGYLQVLERSLITNTSTFLQLSASNLSKVYLIIDDTAILRFIGIKNPSNGPSDYVQIAVSNYSQPNPLISILDSHAAIGDRLTSVTNGNKWNFQVYGQTLTISNTASQFSQSFTLPNAFFDVNGIFDGSNQTFPGATFTGLSLDTACGGQKGNLYGPFVLQVSSYWPKVVIYDQQKYRVFQFSIIQNEQTSHPCPKMTFSLKDQCYNTCPSPYYHRMEGIWGSCVLNCEAESIVDLKERTCKCPNRGILSPSTYNCINGSLSYPYGCYCQNGTFFDKTTHSCMATCPNQLVSYLGLCLPCGKGCSRCSISFNGLYFLTCSQCSTGFTLSNGACSYSSACTANCLTCDSKSICTSCLPFYTLSNGACLASCGSGHAMVLQNLSSSCSVQTLGSQCGVECLKCTGNSICVVCQPGYALLVSPIIATCRRKNLLYSCQSQLYASWGDSSVCYSNDSTSLSKLNSCQNSVSNCFLCHPTQSNTCLLCRDKLLLQENKCVSKCSSNYFPVNQACIPSILQCQINSFVFNKYKQTFTQEIVNSNPFYLNYIRNKSQSTNEPYGFGLYFSQEFMYKIDAMSIDGEVAYLQQSCSQCKKGFGLTANHLSCEPCPSGCLLCLYSTTCLATTDDQVSAISLGAGIAGCQGFISGDNSCVQSCGSDSKPSLNSTLGKVACLKVESSDSSGGNYLRVDGSTYVISDSQYIHRFIFDSPITAATARMLQGSSNLAIDVNGNSITFSSNSPTQILNLTGELTNMNSVNGLYPANTVYGINYQTSFRSFIKKWLASIGYVLSIFLIILQCIYIANGILYKMDNIIIFAQSLFFFLFNQTLIANPVAQFYYGWSWTHLNFFPNYFTPDLDLSEPTIPPYALYNLDGNIIRNAGSTLSFLLTFFLVWGVVSGVLYILDTYYGRKEIWYYKISRDSFIGVIEFFSYNIFYWCMAFINHDKNYTHSGTFIGITVLLLTVLIIYVIGRLYFNLLGGIYMVKRLVFACVLASSFQKTGYVGVIIVLQGCFGVVRSLIERPREKWLLISLWLEEGLVIVFWIILYTTVNAAVVSILTTIFVYAWMLTFVADLADLYFHSHNTSIQIACFKSLFQERVVRNGSTQSMKEESQHKEDNEKGDTERPFSINPGPNQQH